MRTRTQDIHVHVHVFHGVFTTEVLELSGNDVAGRNEVEVLHSLRLLQPLYVLEQSVFARDFVRPAGDKYLSCGKHLRLNMHDVNAVPRKVVDFLEFLQTAKHVRLQVSPSPHQVEVVAVRMSLNHENKAFRDESKP